MKQTVVALASLALFTSKALAQVGLPSPNAEEKLTRFSRLSHSPQECPRLQGTFWNPVLGEASLVRVATARDPEGASLSVTTNDGTLTFIARGIQQQAGDGTAYRGGCENQALVYQFLLNGEVFRRLEFRLDESNLILEVSGIKGLKVDRSSEFPIKTEIAILEPAPASPPRP